MAIHKKKKSNIKEIVKDDGTIIYKTKRKRNKINKKPPLTLEQLLLNYEEISPEDDEYERFLIKKIYSKFNVVWQRKNTSYRIRYTPLVYGSEFDNLNSYGAYIIGYKHNGIWKVLDERYHNLKDCIIHLEKLLEKMEKTNDSTQN